MVDLTVLVFKILIMFFIIGEIKPDFNYCQLRNLHLANDLIDLNHSDNYEN